MQEELRLGEFFYGILPRLRTNNAMPAWPPDCFALCVSLLRRTGAYTRMFANWPPDSLAEGALEEWVDDTRRLGESWRRAWNAGEPFLLLEDSWRTLCDSFELPLDELILQPSLCEVLVRISSAADEASESVGAPIEVDNNTEDEETGDLLLSRALSFLLLFGTACDEIDGSRLRVLPRMHTPQSGLTDRRLSLYLSLHEASEVAPEWTAPPGIQPDSVNLLLIPWPFEVLVKQFREVTDPASAILPDRFGFFAYDVETDFETSERLIASVGALYREAKRKLGRIDGVILPEMALSIEQFNALRTKLPQDCFLVAGVGGPGINEARFSFPPLEDLVQRKHHPWRLNESQVVQYGLGGVLSPFTTWWESGDFTDRRLRFLALTPDLVLTVLICEDLAKADPVANLIRSVGPNLVIALLMDGPQTKERWAARYATILADDPGCSVLSLTSKGMAQISAPAAGPNRSRVIAIWKDYFGPAREIELPEGCEAVAVSLSTRYGEEFAADGRGDKESAAYPVLSGVHPVKRNANGLGTLETW